MRHLVSIFVLVSACGPQMSLESATSLEATTSMMVPDVSTSTSSSSSPLPTGSGTSTLGTLDLSSSSEDTFSRPDVGASSDVGSSNTCDAFLQDCTRGEKCVPWSPDGGLTTLLKCVDITGNVEINRPCVAPKGGADGIDDCILGAICWHLDEDENGFCVGQCTGSIDEALCPSGLACYISQSEAVTVCIPECDPLVQDCLLKDQLCVAAGVGFECMNDASGDTGKFNDTCDAPNGCNPGLVCLEPLEASSACDPLAQGCCQPFCLLPDEPCPNEDQQCRPWFAPPDVLPGYENLGVCAVPE